MMSSNFYPHKEISASTLKVRTLFPIVAIIGVVFVLILSLITGFLSFTVFWLAGLAGAFFFCNRFPSSKYLFELFCFAYVFYTVYMGITTYVLVQNPERDFFFAFDSTKFWTRSQNVVSLSDLWDRFDENAVGFESIGGYRFFYLITLITSFLSTLIDESNIYVQKLAVVFVGALASPYLFMIIKKYTDVRYAYLATLVFAIFSHASTYSVEFLRDSYVYFFYLLGAYLIVTKQQSRSTLWKLLLISGTVLFIRPEHGVFFLSFVAAYVYITKRQNRFVFLLAMISTPVILFVSAQLITMSLETYSTYDDIRQRVGEGTDSLAARFANFPFGIKHLILAFLSQTIGVPFWRYLYYDGVDFASVAYKSHNGWRLLEAISGTLWMFVWGYIIFAIKRYKTCFSSVPREIVVLFLVAVLLLVAGTADINTRRIFCVYPMIYVVAVIVRYKMRPSFRKVVLRNTSFFILLMYLIYFLLKG